MKIPGSVKRPMTLAAIGDEPPITFGKKTAATVLGIVQPPGEPAGGEAWTPSDRS